MSKAKTREEFQKEIVERKNQLEQTITDYLDQLERKIEICYTKPIPKEDQDYLATNLEINVLKEFKPLKTKVIIIQDELDTLL